MPEHIIETESLTKQFGALTANDEITLSVERGSIHGIIGPNGSGKTTFFNTLTGMHQPDGGTVTFDGTDITGWKPHRIARRGLGRTFQIVSPFKNMTVRQNLLAAKTGGNNKRARADEILEFLEIDHLADDEASDMSGGQKKLLELGRVLMLDPDCILLDEPTAGVNPALEQRILDHLEEINNNGTSFLIVEHDMNVIRDVVDRVSVFDQGQHIVEGSFDEVTNDERVREAYLGSADDEEVPI
ncbi:ABC transporter ATP-binding protein [Halobacterium noricense]|uniref:ABC transporter ATP-binding protein n=1 Tax=Halobacterium noricense TaxID=223182 RepID=UPI001E61A386|nr:ABC transporter ATP-binding protein [Halobacterium noricense]UHH26809.1 ABC transporter ATP-binding protein [Halobacterium noricense]